MNLPTPLLLVAGAILVASSIAVFLDLRGAYRIRGASSYAGKKREKQA